MCMNVVSLVLLCISMPYDNKMMNLMSSFNEGVALVVSYFIAMCNDPQYGPESNVVIGEFIVYIIYGSAAFNASLVLGVSLK